MADTFSIRVVDADGEGVEDAEVFIVYSGLLSGGLSEQTDSDGWVTFPVYRRFGFEHPHWVKTVIINNVTVADDEDGVFQPNDGDTFSFTLP